MPTIAKIMEKIANITEKMDKNEYFKAISVLAREKREISTEEKALIEREVVEELKKILCEFHPEKKDLWEERNFTFYELRKYISLEISTLRDKIIKARKIYLTQQRIIENLSQLTID